MDYSKCDSNYLKKYYNFTTHCKVCRTLYGYDEKKGDNGKCPLCCYEKRIVKSKDTKRKNAKKEKNPYFKIRQRGKSVSWDYSI